MFFRKILIVIKTLFGILFFLSFFGVFVSVLFQPRLIIFNHKLYVPPILTIMVFFSAFILILLEPFLTEKPEEKKIYFKSRFYCLRLIILLIWLIIFGFVAIISQFIPIEK
jgi:hypothetical protein